MAEVLISCGEPIAQNLVGFNTQKTRHGWKSGTKTIWYYDTGGGVLHQIHFWGNEVVKIDWIRK